MTLIQVLKLSIQFISSYFVFTELCNSDSQAIAYENRFLWFIVREPYGHIMHFEHIQPLLLFLVPPFITKFNGFHYSIFRHVYKVLGSYSSFFTPPLALPVDPTPTVPLSHSWHFFLGLDSTLFFFFY
jgi:hypothetical protein